MHKGNEFRWALHLFSVPVRAANLRMLAIHSLALLITFTASAEAKVSGIFGDHMVLQRGRGIPTWGTATPGEKIKVTLGRVHAKARADSLGNWNARLNTDEAGRGPLTMIIKATNEVTFSDVLVGDVWVASGQSNMEMELSAASGGDAAIKAGNQPMIRLYTVPRQTAAKPMTDLAKGEGITGRWLVCSPDTLAQGFSAVGYFFGRDIQKFTGGPVGLILSSVGGSPAEAWTSYDGLQTAPQLAIYADKHKKLLDGYDAALAAYPLAEETYQKQRDAWLESDKPRNDDALARWNGERVAALAAGQQVPKRPALIPEPKKPDISGGKLHPTALYNGMIAPIIPYGIKGVIWYQGEANGGKGLEYRYLFRALIESWRRAWGQGDFPFLFVQLPDFQASWALLRESQADALSLPNTGMAVSIDVGMIMSLHPPYKEVVGDRLALLAEHVAYGASVDFSGPLYKSMRIEDSAIRILFDHAEGLRIGKPPVSGPGMAALPTDALVTFTIAGADKQWQPASATIEGDTVVVSRPKVKDPMAVRFGWDPPPVCNLYNRAMLPASPFRTDNWP